MGRAPRATVRAESQTARYVAAMTPAQASTALRGRPTVPVIKASIHAVKELHASCLARDIPAAMARPCDNGG